MRIWQNYLAELLGTFVLVFMSTTGIVASNTLTSGVLTLDDARSFMPAGARIESA